MSVITRRPPGFSTRTISAIAAFGSGAVMQVHVREDRVQRGIFKRQGRSVRHLQLYIAEVGVFSRPASSIAAEASIA